MTKILFKLRPGMFRRVDKVGWCAREHTPELVVDIMVSDDEIESAKTSLQNLPEDFRLLRLVVPLNFIDLYIILLDIFVRRMVFNMNMHESAVPYCNAEDFIYR